MGKIGLKQLVVVINSQNESFEVTKWCDVSKRDPKQVRNELLAISKKLYRRIVEDQRGEDDRRMIGIGEGGQVLEAESSKAREITSKVHYAWYKGHCLDPKKLSYFMPEKTLAEGDMTVEEIRNL